MPAARSQDAWGQGISRRLYRDALEGTEGTERAEKRFTGETEERRTNGEDLGLRNVGDLRGMKNDLRSPPFLRSSCERPLVSVTSQLNRSAPPRPTSRAVDRARDATRSPIRGRRPTRRRPTPSTARRSTPRDRA